MMRHRVPLRIALIGAECTGKTVLAEALAQRLSAILLPERLREFCEEHGRTPRADEQAWLVDTQIEREDEALARATDEGIDWVVCDTTPLLTALYAVMHQRGYALTLLSGPELPWVSDGVRDGPAARNAFHRRLIHTVLAHHLRFVRVEGDVDARIATALDELRRI